MVAALGVLLTVGFIAWPFSAALPAPLMMTGDRDHCRHTDLRVCGTASNPGVQYCDDYGMWQKCELHPAVKQCIDIAGQARPGDVVHVHVVDVGLGLSTYVTTTPAPP